MNRAFFVITLLIINYLVYTITAQQPCLQASNGTRPLPEFVRPGVIHETQVFGSFGHPIQAIITSYTFNCCGAITEWRAIVEKSNLDYFVERPYSITFQVWRPNTSLLPNSSCYSLIGVNRFSQIPLAAPTTADRGIVTGTVPEGEQIQVQPGDIIGFYLESSRADSDGFVLADGYLNEMVWYVTGPGTSISSGQECVAPDPNPTISSFTNQAPLITMTVSQSSCTYQSVQPSIAILLPTPEIQDTNPPAADTTSDITGLYVAIAILIFVIVLIILAIPVGLFCVRMAQKKKNDKHCQSDSQNVNNSDGNTEPTYEYIKPVDIMTTQTNIKQACPVNSISVNNIPITDSEGNAKIEFRQNFTDLPSLPTATDHVEADDSTTDEDDYYVNEGLGGTAELKMSTNKAYGTSRQLKSDKLITPATEAKTHVDTETTMEDDDCYINEGMGGEVEVRNVCTTSQNTGSHQFQDTSISLQTTDNTSYICREISESTGT